MRALIVVLLFTACATPSRAAPMPEWLVGTWLSCEGGREVVETWSGAGAGLLAGVNLTYGARPQFEFLRIAPGADGLTFYGSPGGSPPVAFHAVAQDARRVVFENPNHDFPQRVIYARDGADLTARIEGVENGREAHVDWRFSPATADGRCPR